MKIDFAFSRIKQIVIIHILYTVYTIMSQFSIHYHREGNINSEGGHISSWFFMMVMFSDYIFSKFDNSIHREFRIPFSPNNNGQGKIAPCMQRPFIWICYMMFLSCKMCLAYNFKFFFLFLLLQYTHRFYNLCAFLLFFPHTSFFWTFVSCFLLNMWQ